MLDTGLEAVRRQPVPRDSGATQQWKRRVVRSAENHVRFMKDGKPERKRVAIVRLDRESTAHFDKVWDQEHPTPTDLQLRHQQERQLLGAELTGQFNSDFEDCEAVALQEHDIGESSFFINGGTA